MGLTIHYTLSSSAKTIKEARQVLARFHKAAKKFPFKFVGDEIDEYVGEECDYQKRPDFDAERFTLIHALRYLEVDGQTHTVQPIRVMAFITVPAEGSEMAIYGLARYPRTITGPDGETIPTHFGGKWLWSSSCKTQYVSNPKSGGINAFVKCHSMIVELLDQAGKIGLIADVTDESRYWENRDKAELAETVTKWNAMVAGFVGQFKDKLGGKGVVAPITDFSNYEHLEARGRADEANKDDQDLDENEDEEV